MAYPGWSAGGSGRESGSGSAGAGHVHGRESGCDAADRDPCPAHGRGCVTCKAKQHEGVSKPRRDGAALLPTPLPHRRHSTACVAAPPPRRSSLKLPCQELAGRQAPPRRPRTPNRKHALAAHRLRRSRLLLRSLLLDLRSRLRLLLRRRDLPSRLSFEPSRGGSAPRSSPPRRSSRSPARSGGAPPSLISPATRWVAKRAVLESCNPEYPP